ncbi:hypothetical protein HOY82DRAFT_476952 [Tuber indicum]|nr:hypothetical protein HOY82DRAFT_476952 [Tuber indicum]
MPIRRRMGRKSLWVGWKMSRSSLSSGGSTDRGIVTPTPPFLDEGSLAVGIAGWDTSAERAQREALYPRSRPSGLIPPLHRLSFLLGRLGKCYLFSLSVHHHSLLRPGSPLDTSPPYRPPHTIPSARKLDNAEPRRVLVPPASLRIHLLHRSL